METRAGRYERREVGYTVALTLTEGEVRSFLANQRTGTNFMVRNQIIAAIEDALRIEMEEKDG